MEHDMHHGCLHKKNAKNSGPELREDLSLNLQYLYGLGRLY